MTADLRAMAELAAIFEDLEVTSERELPTVVEFFRILSNNPDRAEDQRRTARELAGQLDLMREDVAALGDALAALGVHMRPILSMKRPRRPRHP